ncbi:hypothetical protein [Agrilutibacter solisilvae]|uniref:hypothetical protein n=1 Tax=Agrilutibacter solisilvae TaxID=2763317 RepID=UPI001FD664EC|nr:hypothetical protein [Lysobacter solisilvae]
MTERAIRTLKWQCIHRHCFECQQHATRSIGDWLRFSTSASAPGARRHPDAHA